MNNSGTFKNLGDLPEDIVTNFKNKEYAICKEKCINVLVSNPNNGIASIYLGKIAESEAEYETAILYYKKVISVFFYIKQPPFVPTIRASNLQYAA